MAGTDHRAHPLARAESSIRPLPEDDPKVRQPDITKAKRVLGWEPKVPVREGLIRTVEWFQAQPSRLTRGSDRMKALVIVPTYNEADNVRELLPRVLEQHQGIEILIVDDNSTDGTGAIVEEMRRTEPRTPRAAPAGQDGPRHRLRGRFPVRAGARLRLRLRDGRRLQPRSRLPARLPGAAEERSADLVLGSRYLNGVTVVNWPLSRLILSYGANVYTRIDHLDAAQGRHRRVQVLPPHACSSSSTWIGSGRTATASRSRCNFKVWRKGLRVREIPIIFTDRRVGICKMNKKIVWEAMWLVWWLRLSALLGRM